MPWVIWDILVPMLATFLIGLATGWLLWRWRRQKVDVAAASLQAASIQPQEFDDSMNVVLIEERDAALTRADAAETELDLLKGQIDLNVMGGALDSTQEPALVATADQQVTEIAIAEAEALGRELEKEKSSKAEVERSLLELNTRYKDLTVRLNEEVSAEQADSLKQAAALESNLEQAKETIAEQSAKLKQLQENQQTDKQNYEQNIAVKDAQLKYERIEREDVRMQLAREKLINEEAADNARNSARNSAQKSVKGGAVDNAVEQDQSKKVHQLTGQPTERGNESAVGSSKSPADTTPKKSASNNSNTTPMRQIETMPRQRPQGDSVKGPVTPSLSVQTGFSGGLSASAGQGGAARAEVTPPIENEVLLSDPEVQETAVAETKTVEVSDSDKRISVPSPAVVPAPRAVTPITAALKNVTSINAGPRKPVNTQQSDSAAVVKNPKPAVTKKKKRSASGYEPTGWSVPEKSPSKAERDDLQQIKGVGPVLEKMLHKTGIFYLRQVALLDKKGVQELDQQIPLFSGRIQRDKWVQQAKTLHRAKYGSAAKK